MFRQDEFTPPESYVRTMRLVYADADRKLDRDFVRMSFGQFVENHIHATRGINELLYIEGGEFMLEARCDEVATRTLEVIKNLRQYRTDVGNYFNSLRKQAVKK